MNWSVNGAWYVDRLPRRIEVLVAIALICPAAPAAFADCTGVCLSNEVAVAEDAHSCSCVDRKVYAACIADKGREWRANRPQCGVKAEQCFRSQGYQLTAGGIAGVACVLNCAAANTLLLLARSCITTCATAVAIATSVLEKCAYDVKNQCEADALAELKQHQLDCVQH